MAETRVYTVSEVTRYIRALLEGDRFLRALWVEGEVSNFRDHPSGHLYFTLKDEAASIRCVMFRSRRSGLEVYPQNGREVLALGYVGVYERDGQYQLYVERLQGGGAVGRLHQAFEALKQKLEAEGLFRADRKKPLPYLPRRVGVVTSPSAAALRDILKVLWRRFPNLPVLLIPAVVQGEEAPESIRQAIERANRHGGLDVLIVGRGGGSLEELWAFNTEPVARAIAASAIPVISAVGHETDVTIADLVADVRAATPSHAAEQAVPDRRELALHLGRLVTRLREAARRRYRRERERLENLVRRPSLLRPTGHIDQKRQRLDHLVDRLGRFPVRIGREQERVRYLRERLANLMERRADRERSRLEKRLAQLDSLSPLGVLARGYSLAQDGDGRILTSYRQVEVGDRIYLRLAEGRLDCRVENVRPDVTQEEEGA